MICEALLAVQTALAVGAPSLPTSRATFESRPIIRSNRTPEPLNGNDLTPRTPNVARPVRVAENVRGSCAVQAKAIEQCAEPWPAEVDRPEDLVPSRERETRAVQLRRFVNLFNSAAAKTVRCERIFRAVREECAGSDHLRTVSPIAHQNLSRLRSWQGELVDVMNTLSKPVDAPLNLNCLMTPRDDVAVVRCYALDPTRPRTVKIEDPDDLEVTVGMSKGCTFTVMNDGRLLSAGHCSHTFATAVVMSQSPRLISAEVTKVLQSTSSLLFTGRPFRDLAVLKSSSNTPGRPFYILTRDASLDQGCTLVDNLYVVCAPAEYTTLNGRRAQVVGFPRIHNRDRLSLKSVMLSEGDVTFDQTTNRVLIHAAMSVGSSGGPTYLASGSTIGGLTLDRPLYLGPVSFVSSGRQLVNEYATDSLVVVGVYDQAEVSDLITTKP